MAQNRKRPGGRPARRRSKRKDQRRSGALTALAVLLLLALTSVAGAAAWLWPRCSGESCPSVASLRDYSPPQATRVFDRNGKLVTHLAPERRIVVPLERIPAHVSGAFLAVEDRRFFQHSGVDYRRAVGAAVRDVQTMSFEQGFSTITMQLARNVFPEHLTRAKTVRRKVWEIFLAREIEREFSKDEILEMYLNQIYLGDGSYGVEAAANGYFGRAASELTPVQAAMLAALPKAPNSYNPRRNPELALDRRNLVLSLMADAQVISYEEAARGRGQTVGLTPPVESRSEAPYFIAAVRKEILERFGPDAETAGLRVHTTVDPDLQRAGNKALRDQLAAVEGGKLGRYRGPNCSTEKHAKPEECLQGLFVAIDARTGDVLALVGGRDFSASQFDRVTQARRQPGSAFKPILFASAIGSGIPITTPLVGPDADDYEAGYRPADHVVDTVSINLRGAMRLSSNRAAVVLGERVGVQNVIQTSRNLGITTPIQPYPSTFLGAAEVIPLELVAAFTAFANGGQRVSPRFIRRVEDAKGNLLWESPIERQLALSPEVAFLATSLMKDVVNRGTGSQVRQVGLPYSVPAAGKTGTTNEAADAWFVGYTSEIAAGVWLGFDRPHRIMHGAGGGSLAAPVWGRAMTEYYKNRAAPADWQPPIDLVRMEIDRKTGYAATADCPIEDIEEEWFLRGTEPHEYCPFHSDPGVGGWFQRRLREIGDIFGGARRIPPQLQPQN
jgi:penicillin-binding protein 1A